MNHHRLRSSEDNKQEYDYRDCSSSMPQLVQHQSIFEQQHQQLLSPQAAQFQNDQRTQKQYGTTGSNDDYHQPRNGSESRPAEMIQLKPSIFQIQQERLSQKFNHNKRSRSSFVAATISNSTSNENNQQNHSSSRGGQKQQQHLSALTQFADNRSSMSQLGDQNNQQWLNPPQQIVPHSTKRLRDLRRAKYRYQLPKFSSKDNDFAGSSRGDNLTHQHHHHKLQSGDGNSNRQMGGFFIDGSSTPTMTMAHCGSHFSYFDTSAGGNAHHSSSQQTANQNHQQHQQQFYQGTSSSVADRASAGNLMLNQSRSSSAIVLGVSTSRTRDSAVLRPINESNQFYHHQHPNHDGAAPQSCSQNTSKTAKVSSATTGVLQQYIDTTTEGGENSTARHILVPATVHHQQRHHNIKKHHSKKRIAVANRSSSRNNRSSISSRKENRLRKKQSIESRKEDEAQGEDRLISSKALSRKRSKHEKGAGNRRPKSKSRKRMPEVVVVCRYPPSTSQNTTSYEQTMRSNDVASSSTQQHPFVYTSKTTTGAVDNVTSGAVTSASHRQQQMKFYDHNMSTVINSSDKKDEGNQNDNQNQQRQYSFEQYRRHHQQSRDQQTSTPFLGQAERQQKMPPTNVSLIQKQHQSSSTTAQDKLYMMPPNGWHDLNSTGPMQVNLQQRQQQDRHNNYLYQQKSSHENDHPQDQKGSYYQQWQTSRSQRSHSRGDHPNEMESSTGEKIDKRRDHFYDHKHLQNDSEVGQGIALYKPSSRSGDYSSTSRQNQISTTNDQRGTTAMTAMDMSHRPQEVIIGNCLLGSSYDHNSNLKQNLHMHHESRASSTQNFEKSRQMIRDARKRRRSSGASGIMMQSGTYSFDHRGTGGRTETPQDLQRELQEARQFNETDFYQGEQDTDGNFQQPQSVAVRTEQVRSISGQRYINYLQRNYGNRVRGSVSANAAEQQENTQIYSNRSSEMARSLRNNAVSVTHSLDRQSVHSRMNSTGTNGNGSRFRGVSPLQNKSVDNAKYYCISKIIGRLDTKRELQRVSMHGFRHHKARRSVEKQFQDALTKFRSQSQNDTGPYRSKYQNNILGRRLANKKCDEVDNKQLENDDSKSSFIQRFQNYHKREMLSKQNHLNDLSQDNSHSDNKHHNDSKSEDEQSQQRRSQSRHRKHQKQQQKELLNHKSQQQWAQRIDERDKSRQHQPTYYTLGPMEESQKTPITNTNLNTNQPQHQQQFFENVQHRVSEMRHEPHQKRYEEEGTYSHQQPQKQKQKRQNKPMQCLLNPFAQSSSQMQESQAQMQEIMSRADLILQKSQERLSCLHTSLDESQKAPSERQQRIESQQHHYQEAPTSVQQTIQSNAAHYHRPPRDRIAELQRNKEEIQRLPEMYNERLASLKKRTTELHTVALSYASGDKNQTNPITANVTLSCDKDQSVGYLPDNREKEVSIVDQQQQQRPTRVSFDKMQQLKYKEGEVNKSASCLMNTQNQENQTSSFHNRTAGESHEKQSHIRRASQEYYDLNNRDSSPWIHHQNHDQNQEGRHPLDLRTQILSEKISMNGGAIVNTQSDEELKNEFEMTKKLEPHAAFSQATYRGPYTQQTIVTDDKYPGSSSQYVVEQNNGHAGQNQQLPTGRQEQESQRGQKDQIRERKQRIRKQRKDRKLQKLKELHELAQYSMTKIASELGSHQEYNANASSSVIGDSARMTQQQQLQLQQQLGSQTQRGTDKQLQSMSQMLSTEPIVSTHDLNGLSGTQTILDDKKESVKTQVEKLANTRKEIKRLIKIQNKHSKLLKQLQKAGVVPKNVTMQQDQKSRNSQQVRIESHASTATISDLSEGQKQYQKAMSSHMLQQMQKIFKYLAQIQQKLDFELEEKRKRTGQSHRDKMTSTHIDNCDEIVNDYNPDILINRHGSYASQPSNSGNVLPQQQNYGSQPSFAATASQQYNYQPPYNNNSQHQNNLRTHKAAQQSTSTNKKNNTSQGTASTLFWETQMAQNNSAIFQGINQNNAATPQQQHYGQNGVSVQASLTYGSSASIQLQQKQNPMQQMIQQSNNHDATAVQTTSNQDQHSLHDRKDDKDQSAAELRMQEDLQRNFLLQQQYQHYANRNEGGIKTPNSMGEHSATIATESDDPTPGTSANAFRKLRDGLSSSALLGAIQDYECGGGKIENTITVTSDLNLNNQQLVFQQTNDVGTNGTDGSMFSLQGIKVEQLCEILSREINRVREESIQQAQDMRQNYEMELQALREEFYAKQNVHIRQQELFQGRYTDQKPTPQMSQTADQINQLINVSHTNRSKGASDNLTARQSHFGSANASQNVQGSATDNTMSNQQQHQQTATNIDQTESTTQRSCQQRPKSQAVLIVQNSSVTEPTVQINAEVPPSVFEELEKVKAERDMYYKKLQLMRQKIEQGKDMLQKIDNENQSNLTSVSGSIQVVQQDLNQLETLSEPQLKHLATETNKAADISSQDQLQEQQQHQLKHCLKQQKYQTDFNNPGTVSVDEHHTRNSRSVNHIIVPKPYDNQQPLVENNQQPRPCYDVKSNTELCTFQHDFSDLAIKQNDERKTFASLDSDPSSFRVQRPPMIKAIGEKGTTTQQTDKADAEAALKQKQRAGKIVHQFRTGNSSGTRTSQTSQKNMTPSGATSGNTNVDGGACLTKPGKYVNVRHNRAQTKQLHHSKMVKESLVQKCHNCLMSSAEVGTGGFNRSNTLSDRSHTSVTHKNAQQKPGIVVSTGIGGNRSLSNECTTFNGGQQAIHHMNSQPTTPIVAQVDSSIAMSIQSNRAAIKAQRPSQTNQQNDHLTFSNGGVDTFNSFRLDQHVNSKSNNSSRSPNTNNGNDRSGLSLSKSTRDHHNQIHQQATAQMQTEYSQQHQKHQMHQQNPPSKSIGGGKSLQSMMARSPQLIERMAAEHEIYLSNFANNTAQSTSFDNIAMNNNNKTTKYIEQQTHQNYEDDLMQQTGGSIICCEEEKVNNATTTTMDHRASSALSIITQYLEKIDKQQHLLQQQQLNHQNQ